MLVTIEEFFLCDNANQQEADGSMRQISLRRCLVMWSAGWAVAWCASLAVAESPQPGKQVACQFTFETGEGENRKTQTVDYWLFVPKDYETRKELPLLVFLHGVGERGDDLRKVLKWGTPRIVADKPEFPFIVVSPQCPDGTRWVVDHIARLTDLVAGTLKVDKRRMYLTGLSMGGSGTWDLLARHPKLFAAAVPICGRGDPDTAKELDEIPIWAFHGDQDQTVPLSASQDMVEAISKIGGKATLTVYPGVDHNSWTQTYENPAVYDWLLKHQRPH